VVVVRVRIVDRGLVAMVVVVREKMAAKATAPLELLILVAAVAGQGFFLAVQ
jgi:hypothetical protein